jgi:cation:H+ antiporter
MFLSVVLLFASLAAILVAAELFTNGIEWLGHKLKLGEGAVGSILAAVGTALPETMIAVVAVIAAIGAPAAAAHVSEEIGIGAILGAPMMLSTLAMLVTGLAVIIFARKGKRGIDMHVDYRVLGRDLRTFFLVYLVALGAAFVPCRAGKIAIGLFLIACYTFYVYKTFTGASKSTQEHELGPLHLQRRRDVPHLWVVIVQLSVALAVMIGGARLFLHAVTNVSHILGIPGLVLSLIITPIATELPEKFNSVLWVRQGKDTLALGNISGAMVFQSSITPAIGILFTSWKLTPDAIASILIAVAATAMIWAGLNLRKKLSPYLLVAVGLLYAVFPIYVFVLRG